MRDAQTTPVIGDYAAGFREEQVDNQRKLEILNSPAPIVRTRHEIASSANLWALISVLILAGGLVLIAVGIKNKKTKSIVLGVVPAVIGAALLAAFFCGVFDKKVSEDEKQQFEKQIAQKRAELDNLQKKIAPGSKISDNERKAVETTYYDKLNELDDLLSGPEDKIHYQVRILLRDAVIKEYNRQNYRLADINLEIRKIGRTMEELEADGKNKHTAELKELKARQDALKEEKAYLDTSKVSVANMRKNLNERFVSKPEDRKLLNTFIARVDENLSKREKELNSAIKMADNWNEIADVTKKYAFVNAFYFDFSSDTEPFFFCTRCYEGLHSWEGMSVSIYTKFFNQFKEIIPTLKLQKSKTPFFEESLKNTTFTPDTMNALSLTYLPHTVSLPLKLDAFTLRNVPGGYDYDEIPGHRNYSLRGLIPAMDELMTVFATSPLFSMHSHIPDTKMTTKQLNYYYKDGDPHGQVFSFLGPDGKEIDGPAAGGLALVRPNEYDRIYPICGFATTAMSQINQIGYVSMPLVSLSRSGSWWQELRVEGAAVAFDEYGYVKYIDTPTDYYKLFRAYGGIHVYNYAPLTSNFCGSLNLVNGFTDGKFTNFRTNARVATGEGYAYADRDMKAKIYFYNETFILGSTPEDPIGKGISIEPEDLLGLNVSRVAIDNTIQLNLGRLEKLHKRNIFNGVIEQYHDKAEQHKREAKIARGEDPTQPNAKVNINLARAHEVFGQTLAIRAYRPLRDTIDDLVKSVLILLILTIPFAFALERLLIGSTNIYKQMGWILIFFVATFLLLYFTHPAFALSQAPLIIFIAFFIIVMSVVVIYIVMNRFKSELMALQGMDTSAHRVSSENSMVLAAILIGVSSMRNRPVKTFLTILTIMLLTFTIISFASFDSTEYVRPVYMGDASGEVRIESFLPQHVDVLMPLCQSIKDLYENDYDVYFRSASYNSPFYMLAIYPMQTNIIYNPKSTQEEKSITLEAIVGFEPGEASRSAKLASLMPKPASIPAGTEKYPGVYLSTLTAEKMELKPGDVFYLRNMKVRLDGTFKAADLDSFTYLDNGKAVPPNFQATATAEEAGVFSIFNKAYVDASNFIWSSPDLSLLTDYETANKINGFINAVVLYPKADRNPDIIKDATSIAEVTFGIVYSNTINGVHRHFMAPVFSASGISNLIVPLLLGA